MATDYPYADTDAAKMLSNGLRTAASEQSLSLRQIGKRLGYRQPVVLSHWATGRTPIPIDRATEVANGVGLPTDRFLKAVLHQRHPGVEWGLITGAADPFLRQLEQSAGKPLTKLSAEHRRVLREVVEDSKPEERWIGIPEVAALRFLRKLFPNMQTGGLSEEDRDALHLAVELRNADDAAGEDQPKANEGKKSES